MMGAQQEKEFVKRLLGSRDPDLVHRMYSSKPVRDVYTPPTRGVSGVSPVMSKN